MLEKRTSGFFGTSTWLEQFRQALTVMGGEFSEVVGVTQRHNI